MYAMKFSYPSLPSHCRNNKEDKTRDKTRGWKDGRSIRVKKEKEKGKQNKKLRLNKLKQKEKRRKNPSFF